MEQLKKLIQELQSEIDQAGERIGLNKLEEELKQVRTKMAAPDFWHDNLKAQEVSKKEADLVRRIDPWKELQTSINDLAELAEVGDESMHGELEQQLSAINAKLSTLKKELNFRGPFDDHDVILSIYAGAGGTDAQDWAQMLLRMYVRWAEAHNLKVQTIDQTAGEEAGIKSVTLEFTGGSYLYGKIAGEHGVHRLVRLSPTRSEYCRA
jgi:peptide chain release factor 2